MQIPRLILNLSWTLTNPPREIAEIWIFESARFKDSYTQQNRSGENKLGGKTEFHTKEKEFRINILISCSHLGVGGHVTSPWRHAAVVMTTDSARVARRPFASPTQLPNFLLISFLNKLSFRQPGATVGVWGFSFPPRVFRHGKTNGGRGRHSAISHMMDEVVAPGCFATRPFAPSARRLIQSHLKVGQLSSIAVRYACSMLINSCHSNSQEKPWILNSLIPFVLRGTYTRAANLQLGPESLSNQTHPRLWEIFFSTHEKLFK